jgi:hypothetical protein
MDEAQKEKITETNADRIQKTINLLLILYMKYTVIFRGRKEIQSEMAFSCQHLAKACVWYLPFSVSSNSLCPGEYPYDSPC